MWELSPPPRFPFWTPPGQGVQEGPWHKPRVLTAGHRTSCLVPRGPFSSPWALHAEAQSLSLWDVPWWKRLMQALGGGAGGGWGGWGNWARLGGLGGNGLSTVCLGAGGRDAVDNLGTVLCGNPAQPGQHGVEGGHREAAGSRDPLLEGPLLPTLHILSCPWRSRCWVANLQMRKLRSRGSASCLEVVSQEQLGAKLRAGGCSRQLVGIQAVELVGVPQGPHLDLQPQGGTACSRMSDTWGRRSGRKMWRPAGGPSLGAVAPYPLFRPYSDVPALATLGAAVCPFYG